MLVQCAAEFSGVISAIGLAKIRILCAVMEAISKERLKKFKKSYKAYSQRQKCML